MSEKEAIGEIQTLKADIEATKLMIEQAERATDLQKAAELKYGKLRELEQKLKAAEAPLNTKRGGRLLKEEVDEEDIAEIVSKWTGVPVTKLLEGEVQKLLRLEEHLHQRVIGQQEAIEVVSNGVRRARAGLKDPKRPIGSLCFGTYRCWKNRACKSASLSFFMMMNRRWFASTCPSIKRRHTVARLIGAPPGYIGYDEGGELTEAVRRRS